MCRFRIWKGAEKKEHAFFSTFKFWSWYWIQSLVLFEEVHKSGAEEVGENRPMNLSR